MCHVLPTNYASDIEMRTCSLETIRFSLLDVNFDEHAQSPVLRRDVELEIESTGLNLRLNARRGLSDLTVAEDINFQVTARS